MIDFPISMVIPVLGRAGGVRTSIEMASRLADTGIDVRILVCGFEGKRNSSYTTRLVNLFQNIKFGKNNMSWESSARCQIINAPGLKQINWRQKEVVVAVGTFTIEVVSNIDADIAKCRWCKGFSEHRPEEMQRAWSKKMPTAVVSSPLSVKIEQLSGEKVWAVVPNGIDTKVYFENSQISQTAIGVIFSPNPKKDPHTTLEMVRQIKMKRPDVHVLSFGAVRRPKGFAVDEYVPYPSVERARELYSRSRVWVIPSKSEGFCNPILEAMSCGSTIVSTDHDSVRGLINPDKNGILTTVGDPEALANAAIALFDDMNRRRRFIEASRHTVESFSWESAANMMLEFVRRVTDQHVAQRKLINGQRP